MGTGFTVIVKSESILVQPTRIGVIVIVADWSTIPVFVTVKLEISPVPFEANPIEMLLLLHSKDKFGTFPEKLIPANSSPAHKIVSAIKSTSNTGVTMKSNSMAVPSQPLKVGMTVMFAVSKIFPLFTVVKERISPVPLLPKPMFVLSFVHV